MPAQKIYSLDSEHCNEVSKSSRSEASRSLSSRPVLAELLIMLLFVLHFIATQVYLYQQKLTEALIFIHKAIYAMGSKLMKRVRNVLVDGTEVAKNDTAVVETMVGSCIRVTTTIVTP